MKVLDLFLRGALVRQTGAVPRLGAALVLSLQLASNAQAQASCILSVPVNTVVTLDLATCIPGGFVPTGVTIVTTPSHGAATASGTTITYTPAADYFGADSFAYFGTDAGGPSPLDTVSVTVTGRPDAAQDRTARAVLTSQIATAQRFSRAQISNVQRRMESLHRPPGVDESGASAAAGLKPTPSSEGVVALIKSRALDLAGVGRAVGLNGTPDRSGATNYWIDGVASFGTRDASAALAGLEFSTSGISIGMDRRLSDSMAWGLGLGYARDKSTIGNDGTVSKAKGYSLTVYGSYLPSAKTYLDGLLGVGSLDFASSRFVAPAGAFAQANRNGTQVFGALTGGYEWRDNNMLVSPYGRLDFSIDRFDTSTESGAGVFSLSYFGQRVTSLQGALGVRAESVHAASFGYAVPRVRAEFQRGFKGTGQTSLGFVGGPFFGITTVPNSRDSLLLGLGSDFLMRDGLTLSLEYQLNHSFSNSSSHALRVRLSKDLDAKGMPKLKLAEVQREEDAIDWQFDGGVTSDDNVTRAKTGPDRLRDDLYGFHVGGSLPYPLTEKSRMVYTGTFGGQKFHRFNGLSNLQAGIEAEYQFRESSEFSEPTYGVFGRYTLEQFESRLRNGYRFAAGVSVRYPLTDRIGTFAAFSHNVRNARSQVFSNRDNAVRGNIDYALSGRETIYLSSELRVGDIVSTGRPSLENVTIAKVFAQDDAFAGGQMFAYKVDGRTWLTTIGYNLGFGERDSIDLSWRLIRATPSERPAFAISPRSYKANQLSAVYLMRF